MVILLLKKLRMEIYNANGNIIGIYNNHSQGVDFQEKQDLINFSKQNNIDTVMILDKINIEQNLVSTRIFEPNSGANGEWSTMCGNGVRAVARHFQEKMGGNGDLVKIDTPSGILEVAHSRNGFRVEMGSLFTHSQRYLASSISNWEFLKKLFAIDNSLVISIRFGFTSTNQKDSDGEPHLCIEFEENLSLDILKDIALRFGQNITNNFLAFPQAINANFYSVQGERINLVTHERNLGTSAEKSITQSCGTGSTVVGGLYLRERNVERIYVTSIGGDLLIELDNDTLFMTGDAVRVNN